MKTKEIIFELDNKKKFNSILNYTGHVSEISAIISHGANNDMNNPLLSKIAMILCENNIPVLRFNFPYVYEKRKSPDTNSNLKKTWIKAYKYMRNHKDFPSKKIITIGKSLGGRISAEVCAEKILDPDLMIFLGYPMHAPGRKDKIKDSNLYLLNSDLFFVSGTKDPLCHQAILERVVDKIGNKASTYFIHGGGHSLTSKGMTPDDIDRHYDFIASELMEIVINHSF